MEARAHEQNMIAIGAAAVTMIRVLIPIAGKIGRAVWHWLDSRIGALTKDEQAPEVDVPELTEDDQQRQQPQQPQQPQQEVVTPSNAKVKQDSSGKITIYSKSPEVNGDLLPTFEATTQFTTTTVQYGPPRTTYKFGPPIAKDYDQRFQQDIHTVTRNSIQDGKR